MYSVSKNGIITLSAGDDFEFPVFINAGDEWEPLQYSLRDQDRMYFVIAEPNQPFEQAVVRKILTKDDVNADGNIVVHITHDDTKHLVPGTYYYEAKVMFVTADRSWVSTIIPRRKFFII